MLYITKQTKLKHQVKTTDNADIPVSKTKTVKAKDLEKGVREEIAKEKQEKEIEVIEEQYAKIKVDKDGIAKIDFEQAIKTLTLLIMVKQYYVD